VPGGAIQDQHGMRAGRARGADLKKMPVHRMGVGARQHQPRADPAVRANRPEEIGQL
jgi:hypothetical protein